MARISIESAKQELSYRSSEHPDAATRREWFTNFVQLLGGGVCDSEGQTLLSILQQHGVCGMSNREKRHLQRRLRY